MRSESLHKLPSIKLKTGITGHGLSCLNFGRRRKGHIERPHFALVNASLIDLFKHLAIVAIVDVNSDKDWARSIECLFQHRGNLIW